MARFRVSTQFTCSASNVEGPESRDLGLGFELKLQALVGVCYLSLVAWIRTQSNGRRYVPSPSVAVSSQCNSF